jgi:hypothetical protein
MNQIECAEELRLHSEDLRAQLKALRSSLPSSCSSLFCVRCVMMCTSPDSPPPFSVLLSARSNTKTIANLNFPLPSIALPLSPIPLTALTNPFKTTSKPSSTRSARHTMSSPLAFLRLFLCLTAAAYVVSVAVTGDARA